MQSLVTDETSALITINNILADMVGTQKYKIWFNDSARMTLADGCVKVGVPNHFIAGWMESHFASAIAQAAKQATGQPLKVTFNIDHDLAASPKRTHLDSHRLTPQTKPAKIASPKAHSKLPKLTFDTFVVGASNQLAYNAAKTVASESKSPFNPLFIHGGYGVGKTHLLQGICAEICRNRPETNWIYLSAEDFANQFVLALKTKKLEAFRRRLRETELLAIDDIHFLASKPSTQEEFLHTFNTIDMAGKQVVLGSDAHPKMIGQLSEKLVNRFVSGMVVKIETPDFKTRCEICRQYAASLNKQMPENVVQHIAQNVRNNVRELQGAMIKVFAFASLQNQKPDLSMAKEILADHIARTDPIVHVSDIESAVASYFGITPSCLHSSKKDRTVSLARHFSMYLARKHTNMSFPEVGKCMGNKNHATVILACRKIEDELKKNADLHWQTSAGNRVVSAKKVLASLEESISA